MYSWVGLCLLWTATADLATVLSREGYFGYPTNSGSEITCMAYCVPPIQGQLPKKIILACPTPFTAANALPPGRAMPTEEEIKEAVKAACICKSGGKCEDETRNKRTIYGLLGIALKGYETAKKLLYGAKHLYTVTTTRKIYVKRGDYRTALANFRAAKLSEVKDFELPGGVKGKIGESGDRIVTIQTMGESGYPTMKIIRRSGDGSKEIDIVVYIKSKKKESPK